MTVEEMQEYYNLRNKKQELYALYYKVTKNFRMKKEASKKITDMLLSEDSELLSLAEVILKKYMEKKKIHNHGT